jgi:type IV pilus assembly protein PilA
MVTDAAKFGSIAEFSATIQGNYAIIPILGHLMTNPTPKKSMSTTNQLLIGLGVGCGCFGAIFLGGIILAIALPSFLNQANKAKESEGKSYVGSLTRAQQAYFLENEKFASSLSELASVVPSSTGAYTYTMAPLPGKKTMVTIMARPKRTGTRSFVGAVQVTAKGKEKTTEAIVCKTALPNSPVEAFENVPGPLTCPGAMISVSQ